MRFWGWGEDAFAGEAPAAALAWLTRELGGLGDPAPHVALQDVCVGESALPGALRERFGEILRDDHAARVLHARGKSYPDLVRQRAGDALDAPDAVVTPRSHDEVRTVLDDVNSTASKPPVLIASRISAARRRLSSSLSGRSHRRYS